MKGTNGPQNWAIIPGSTYVPVPTAADTPSMNNWNNVTQCAKLPRNYVVRIFFFRHQFFIAIVCVDPYWGDYINNIKINLWYKIIY